MLGAPDKKARDEIDDILSGGDTDKPLTARRKALASTGMNDEQIAMKLAMSQASTPNEKAKVKADYARRARERKARDAVPDGS